MVATKKAKPGAFKRNNAGPAGLRNAAVDAADEPDAGARATAAGNECPPVALAPT